MYTFQKYFISSLVLKVAYIHTSHPHHSPSSVNNSIHLFGLVQFLTLITRYEGCLMSHTGFRKTMQV